jgi:hypothetical protein
VRRGEDTGARSHLGPDDELRFDEGSITLELDAIDDVERQFFDSPIANFISRSTTSCGWWPSQAGACSISGTHANLSGPSH